jgi:hypothetical protein
VNANFEYYSKLKGKISTKHRTKIQGDPRWAVGDLALGGASDLSSQAPHTKKALFCLVFAWQSGMIFASRAVSV